MRKATSTSVLMFASSFLPFGNCRKAIKYYLETICYSPDRFDSWAGLALGRSRLILDKLNLVRTLHTPLIYNSCYILPIAVFAA